MAITKGTQVRQILPTPVEGVVDSFAVDQETGAVQVHVVWGEGDDQHGRFFQLSEIEEVNG